jgi:hypothetical protein
MLPAASSVLEGKAMGASLPQATISVERAGRLSRWLSAFNFTMPADQPADRVILSNWLAEAREMRSRASALAEKPPLTSY